MRTIQDIGGNAKQWKDKFTLSEGGQARFVQKELVDQVVNHGRSTPEEGVSYQDLKKYICHTSHQKVDKHD